MAAALLACSRQVRHATRTDPIAALRCDWRTGRSV